jgi:tetratricopeptide (TPR) repeat protein
LLFNAVRLCVTQALEIEPESESLQEWLKKAKAAQGEFDKANGLVDEGVGLFQAKSVPEAAVKFEEALEVWPGHARALEWLANCRQAEKEEQEAIDRFNESEANKELIRAAGMAHGSLSTPLACRAVLLEPGWYS